MRCLHELFPSVEAALIRDVYDNVNKDTPKAIEELLILQVCLPVNLLNFAGPLCALSFSACSEQITKHKLALTLPGSHHIRHVTQRFLGVQKVEDHVQCLESSSDTSTSVNGADNNGRSEAGSSSGAHIWDTSGVAVDYTFKVNLAVWREPMLFVVRLA